MAEVFEREASDEVANMAALMVINALVFHNKLSSSLAVIPPPPPISNIDTNTLVDSTISSWNEILHIDYYPIFGRANEILQAMPAIDAEPFLESCRSTANRLVSHPAVGRHDLAGQIFNRLVANRKFLATYYTSIPAATMLASLALAPDRWPDVDWSNIEAIKNFVVLDPACGTGTLLMSSYQQIMENYRRAVLANGGIPDLLRLHRALVEDSIHGADVVDAGIHLTASTLASMSPEVRFQRMNLSVFPLDFDPLEGARLGSLEWMDGDTIQATFSGSGTRIGPTATRKTTFVQRPQPNLVIANPPYTRSTGNDGDERRVFGHKPGIDQRAMSSRLSTLISGTPANQKAGLASAFAVLADKIINPGDQLAFVLPITMSAGSVWGQVRKFIAEKYDVELVVTSHDNEYTSMSHDTAITELLIVLRKRHRPNVQPRGRFVNLWRSPETETQAVALANAIKRLESVPITRIDAAPRGGIEVYLGNDKWAEIVDAPLDPEKWIGNRWRQTTSAQLAWSLVNGIVWKSDSEIQACHLPIASLASVADISGSHLQIVGGYGGDRGPFQVQAGFDSSVNYPAMWRYSHRVQKSLTSLPNAHLVARGDSRENTIWSQSGHLHITPDVRYTSQSILATRTNVRSLGVTTWHTLKFNGGSAIDRNQLECSLALWMNSSFGMFMHANHSNPTQWGRGRGSLTMLRSLPTLDVRKLADWQLDAAQGVFMDMRDAEFEPFYKCATDPVRIRLDEGLVRDVLGLGDDGAAAIARVRELLAQEPSIYGNKRPEPPRRSRLL